MAESNRDLRVPTVGRINQPVHFTRNYASAEQFLARPDDNRAIRLAELRRRTSGREILREGLAAVRSCTSETCVRADMSFHRYVMDRSGAKRRRVAAQAAREFRVIAVGNEADFLTFRLVGND